MFCELLKELEVRIRNIIDDWDKLRDKEGDDGDPDNDRITPRTRKAKELFSAMVNEIIPPDTPPKGIVESWVGKLREEAQFNIPSYTECFIAENLLREHIRHTKQALTPEAQTEVVVRKQNELNAKGAANLSIEIRQLVEDLQYLSMDFLANMIDKVDPIKTAGLSRDAKIYKPVRDAICHTSLLTPDGKDSLTLTFKNIKARLQKLLDENNP